MPEMIPLRRKLQQGQTAGLVGGLHNADLIDFLGQFGIDGVLIECEHGPVDWQEIADYSRACDLWNMASVVRVNANEPWLITRTLDRGASGIAVPHVNTKAEAERAVRACKFGPVGSRGMFSGRRSYGVTDYFRRANEETVLSVFIEEAEAVRNLAEILTVDHIDVFFVAPSDLAQSMGHTGNPGHPDVQRAIDDSIKRIIDAGRVAGTTVVDETRERYLDMGVRFVHTQWQPWLASGVKAYRAALDARNR